MLIPTSRFGNVDLSQEDIITFPEGLLGFANLRRFVLLDDPNDEIFAWLQSCETAEVAFPVLEPELFASDYKISISKTDMEALKLKSMDRVRYFSIITIPEDATQMTANLKAPIVVNVAERLARQCVLQDNDLAIREPIFSKLQQRMMHSLPIKSNASDGGLAIKLPPLGEGIAADQPAR
ncbi:MAG TPA: flagellar assembly protein FliW [Bdellovibrionales bacterium]|nr:flagellar assembly protein FliW [Bdellovibrionales bacterium]